MKTAELGFPELAKSKLGPGIEASFCGAVVSAQPTANTTATAAAIAVDVDLDIESSYSSHDLPPMLQ